MSNPLLMEIAQQVGYETDNEGQAVIYTGLYECREHDGLFDDNPGKDICKTCEDWLVEGKVNACLIAAAPDLLAALRKAVDHMSGDHPPLVIQKVRQMASIGRAFTLGGILAEARAAITKATGEKKDD